MKIKILLMLLVVSTCYAQVTDVLTNLSSAGVANLAYNGNFIYYTSFNNKKVFRFDYTIANPTSELVYQFSEKPNYLYVYNNILYVGAESSFKTYKINLLEQSPSVELVANICGPMIQIGNDLYIGQYVDAKIMKINLVTNQLTEVVSGYQPNFFTLHNGELYFTSNTTNSLYKLNSETNAIEIILTNLDYAAGIAINDQYLFVCQSISNTISYYSLPNFEYVNNIQLSLNSWPNGIIIIENELYFVQTLAGKISKVEWNTLSNAKFNYNKENITIYPNPTTDFINIKGDLNNEIYTIYNLEGKQVKSEFLNENRIDVSYLSNGTYILLLDDKPTTFIKK